MRELTQLINSGRIHGEGPQSVNPPLVRASTVLFPSVEAMNEVRRKRDDGEQIFSYGVRGTPTTHALEDAVSVLEHGDRSFIYPSGLSALAAVILTYAKPGDHLCIIDTVYPPVRKMCDNYLSERGVAVTYFAPTTAGLQAALRPETSLILAETPGSGTFELIDLPAFAALAKANDSILAVDNSWGAGLFFKPLDHGADISIQAGTKYLCGHSDIMLGTVSVKGETYKRIHETNVLLGFCTSPDDCYLALRGIRTLNARLNQHQASALRVAQWLHDHPQVDEVYYPALPSSPYYEIWKRDFRGASGLFSFSLKDARPSSAVALIDQLKLFGIGASWGGYESLALPVQPHAIRTASKWSGPEMLIRLHIGLEDVDDLIDDLERGLLMCSSSTQQP